MSGSLSVPLQEWTDAFQNTPSAKCVSFSMLISGLFEAPNATRPLSFTSGDTFSSMSKKGNDPSCRASFGIQSWGSRELCITIFELMKMWVWVLSEHREYMPDGILRWLRTKGFLFRHSLQIATGCGVTGFVENRKSASRCVRSGQAFLRNHG